MYVAYSMLGRHGALRRQLPLVSLQVVIDSPLSVSLVAAHFNAISTNSSRGSGARKSTRRRRVDPARRGAGRAPLITVPRYEYIIS